MAQDILQVRYDELAQIGQTFGQEAENLTQMQQQIKAVFDILEGGDLRGNAGDQFFAEMNNLMFPATQRLITALHQAKAVVGQVSNILSSNENDASNLFHGDSGSVGGAGAGAGAGQEELSGAVTSGNLPPPRIYIVNGINGDPTTQQADRLPEQLKAMLAAHGYDASEILVSPIIYDTANSYATHLEGTQLQGTNHGGWLSPVDWLSGAGASLVNGATGMGADAINGATGWFNKQFGQAGGLLNTGVGVYEVTKEYTEGANGQYTQRVYNFIQNDLSSNPLLPGQSVMLIGHSGGGAVVGNLTPMIENNLHTDVSGVVTVGSPMLNADQIHPYAKYTNITDRFDFGQPLVRSAEGTQFIPKALGSLPVIGAVSGGTGVFGTIAGTLGADVLARDPGTTYVWTNSGNKNPLAAHSSYGNSQEVLNIIRQQYPDVGQFLNK